MGASKLWGLKTLFVLLVVSFWVTTAPGAEPSIQSGRYTFLSDRSTIVQSGGIAGVHWTYAIEGQFCLIVDPDAGTARFEQVDANAVDASEPVRVLDPNTTFHLESLTGTVVDETTVTFTGSIDIRTIELTVTFEDDAVLLTGTAIERAYDGFIFELDATATRKYAGGTGDPNTPYQIATAEQMNAIGTEPNDWDKHFQLTADIDLGDYRGTEFNIIGGKPKHAFTGTFDGNGYAILHFTYSVDQPDKDLFSIGLFSCVDSYKAEIRRVRLLDANVSVLTAKPAGLLVGYLEDGATITDCHVTGRITGSWAVGGLVGFIDRRGEIINCGMNVTVTGGGDIGGLVGYNEGSLIECYTNGDVTGIARVGGLVGNHDGNQVKNSYSISSVSGERDVGGVVGFLSTRARITNCYASGMVLGQVQVGGLVGDRPGSWPFIGIIHDSFWDTEATNQATSMGGSGKSTTEMQTAHTFLGAGWDFVDETENGTEDIWWIVEGLGYPRLSWERLLDNYVVLLLDDFERYTTDEGNYFWDTYVDGWLNDTGAVVGCVDELCALQAIVTFHSGKQSMPFEYNNDETPYYSEIERIWEEPRDWTIGGADTLTLYFIGQADNEPDNLYVAIEDDAEALLVLTHPNADALLATEWQEWHIPLANFQAADINVSSVRKMVIGVGNRDAPRSGGTGRIFLDDIQVTKRVPQS